MPNLFECFTFQDARLEFFNDYTTITHLEEKTLALLGQIVIKKKLLMVVYIWKTIGVNNNNTSELKHSRALKPTGC